MLDVNYMYAHTHTIMHSSFSKRDVEANALQMAELDFCDQDEKKLIEEIFNNAIDSLTEDDKQLPQATSFLFTRSEQ